MDTLQKELAAVIQKFKEEDDKQLDRLKEENAELKRQNATLQGGYTSLCRKIRHLLAEQVDEFGRFRQQDKLELKTSSEWKVLQDTDLPSSDTDAPPVRRSRRVRRQGKVFQDTDSDSDSSDTPPPPVRRSRRDRRRKKGGKPPLDESSAVAESSATDESSGDFSLHSDSGSEVKSVAEAEATERRVDEPKPAAEEKKAVRYSIKERIQHQFGQDPHNYPNFLPTIGKKMAAHYRETHAGENPAKRDEKINDKHTSPVCVYGEDDWEYLDYLITTDLNFVPCKKIE